MVRSDRYALSAEARNSWRIWLLTGARREPADRRRIRGSHMRLRRMLVEGMPATGERPYGWKEFSDAMTRHAVGDAVQGLPLEEGRLVKLAYFGGFSNGELASRLGVTERTVTKRLNHAMQLISGYVEHGRRAGRRVACALCLLLSARWLHELGPWLAQAGTVAGTATVLFAQPAPPPSLHGQAPAPAHPRAVMAAPRPVQAAGGGRPAAGAQRPPAAPRSSAPSTSVSLTPGTLTVNAPAAAIPPAGLPPVPWPVPSPPRVQLPASL